MKTNTINNANTANVQVYREEVRGISGEVSHAIYYLGWGDSGSLIEPPLSFEELTDLHTLIGQVISHNRSNN